LTCASSAFADKPGEKQARAAELKRAADAAFDAKHYEEALALYDQSYGLSPQTAIYYNRGRVFQYLARYPQALDQLEKFKSEAPPELRSKVPGFDAVLADVRAKVATVDVRCDVAGARVLIGGADFGTTPLSNTPRVNAGKQEIEVIADGYFPYRRELGFQGDATTTVRAELVSRDKNALLQVKSSLDGTHVYIDDRPIGVAPTETPALAGLHVLSARKDGFDDASTQIVLKAGEKRELTLDPLTKPSLVTRWWFWSAIGVVAAGAVVSVVAATTEKSPPTGSFSPGRIQF
jgi:hypothetical protein